jgi:hypothetical protein
MEELDSIADEIKNSNLTSSSEIKEMKNHMIFFSAPYLIKM